MRNRAKCKLCGEILESFHRHDFVTCKCGEISIDGGKNYFHASAKNYDNFLRVDDNDHEFKVTYVEEKKSTEQETSKESPPQSRPQSTDHSLPSATDNKKELIMIVDEMIKNIERLPPNAQTLPLNQYDMMSLLLLFKKYLEI